MVKRNVIGETPLIAGMMLHVYRGISNNLRAFRALWDKGHREGLYKPDRATERAAERAAIWRVDAPSNLTPLYCLTKLKGTQSSQQQISSISSTRNSFQTRYCEYIKSNYIYLDPGRSTNLLFMNLNQVITLTTV